MKQKLIQLFLWLASLLGWKPQTVSMYIEEAKFAVRQVEEKFKEASGEFKRAQALRMMLNITNAAERDCARAIEEAVDILYPRKT